MAVDPCLLPFTFRLGQPDQIDQTDYQVSLESLHFASTILSILLWLPITSSGRILHPEK